MCHELFRLGKTSFVSTEPGAAVSARWENESAICESTGRTEEGLTVGVEPITIVKRIGTLRAVEMMREDVEVAIAIDIANGKTLSLYPFGQSASSRKKFLAKILTYGKPSIPIIEVNAISSTTAEKHIDIAVAVDVSDLGRLHGLVNAKGP